jgi:hypothetical protein
MGTHNKFNAGIGISGRFGFIHFGDAPPACTAAIYAATAVEPIEELLVIAHNCAAF